MKVIFFGTPLFAAKTLEYLLNHGVEVAAVITKPDKPKGRSGSPVATPVKAMVHNLNPTLPVYQPEFVSNPEFAHVLPPFQADLFVVVAYGEIIKQHLLDMPRFGCINLHASLLPKYRGAAPIQRCLMEGETESGVSIIQMAKKMDAGDILKIVTVPINENMTFGDLEHELCEVGNAALLEVIHDFENGTVTRIPQDHTKATLAPKIELENCKIDWNQTAEQVHNLVRGVNPYPGAWTQVAVRGKPLRLKVSRTQRIKDLHGKPGEILNYGSNGLVIACGKEAVLLQEIQLEGKRTMLAEEMMLGIKMTEFLIII